LIELLEGKLVGSNRDKDAEELEHHVSGCAFCKKICVDHVHEIVTIPLLKAEAKKLGIPLNTLLAQLQKTGERMVTEGKFHRKQEHREE
jgi:hypothetical protein